MVILPNACGIRRVGGVRGSEASTTILGAQLSKAKTTAETPKDEVDEIRKLGEKKDGNHARRVGDDGEPVVAYGAVSSKQA